jgi:hypothetical protein
MPRTPEHLWKGIADSELARSGVTAGTVFGRSQGLRVSGKVFAMLVKGELVVKLPKERVADLTASGGGAPVRCGPRPVHERVGLGYEQSRAAMARSSCGGEGLRRLT